jgi:putative DNA primase/helicase
MSAAASNRISDADIERAQAISIADIAIERGLPLKKVGGELIGGCPHCGGRDRFGVSISANLFNCRACGIGGHGAIRFLMWVDGVGFPEAVARLTGRTPPGRLSRWDNSTRATGAEGHRAGTHRQRDKARWLWSQRRSIAGSIVEVYLRTRGIACPLLPSTLGFLPPTKPGHCPAMIAAFGLVAETEPGIIAPPHDVQAVHLTLLRVDGSGKADVDSNKIFIGSPSGTPITLAPPTDLLGLSITEGIEDSLSVHQATGLGAWAAGAAGFMPKLADVVPTYIDSITINAHADKAGQDGATKLAAKLRARDIDVTIEGIDP